MHIAKDSDSSHHSRHGLLNPRSVIEFESGEAPNRLEGSVQVGLLQLDG
jgi:hypothetical protein